jgi:hypothetical protein
MYLYCTTKISKSNALKRGTGFDGVGSYPKRGSVWNHDCISLNDDVHNTDGVTRKVKHQFGFTKYQQKNPVKKVKYIDTIKKVCYNKEKILEVYIDYRSHYEA